MKTRKPILLGAIVSVTIAALMAAPVGGMLGLIGASGHAPATEDRPRALDGGSRSVDYRWYDMFNVPFGEWYDVRWRMYHNEQIISDTFPYIFKTHEQPAGNTKYYTNMRLDITGRNMTELNMNSHPEFLPFLGTARGGNAVIDWYMRYLTSAEVAGTIYSNWNDGWLVSLNGTTTMDKQAAMAVLNVSSAGFDDFASWWGANERNIENTYSAWLLSEGNKRLDIYSMYEYPLTPLSFDLTAQRVADKIVLSYDMVSWGMEALMTRWLHDAFMPTEWYFEDFSIDATIGPDVANLDIGTVVAYAAYAWELMEAPGEPCWVWEGMLQDYVAPSIAHPFSDFVPYMPLTYWNLGPGSYWHGRYMPYDYTPGSWNLPAGERLSFTWPSDVVQFIRHVATDNVTSETGHMYLSYSEPDDADLPDNVAVDYSAKTAIFTGPLDIWTWSKEQTNHQNLSREWQRLGILPRGMPYLQFGKGSAPPSEPHQVIKGAQGPRESAVTWEYVPANYGIWTGYIENNGLRSLVVDVYDITGGASEQISHEKIRFAVWDAYPTGTVMTRNVIVAAGHVYSITATPNGPKGSSCTVDDMLRITPPWAQITIVSMIYLAVVVDGAASYSPNGVIVSYDWSFGDGWTADGCTANHTYAMGGTYLITLTVTDSAGLTADMSVLVTLVPPPHWASFTCYVDGLTVNVDASSSMDDHGIVSYSWDWGDGTNGTGMTASHTYAIPGNSTSAISGRDFPPIPHGIFGFTYAADGVTPINGCVVTITNTRTGEYIVFDDTHYGWDPNLNVYTVDLSELQSGWTIGDVLHVTAVKGTASGWAEAPVTDNSVGYDQIDVVLSPSGGSKNVTITLTVMDSMGQTDSVSQQVTIYW